MDGLTIRCVGGLPLDSLATAFNRAFEGYFVPMWQTTESLAAMIANNDVLLDASLLIEDDRGAFAGIALLGVRGARGWVAGMGVAPEWRGRRVGHELMSRLIDEARALRLCTIQLEVLDQNIPARRLYSSLGFQEIRPLVVYTGPITPPELESSAEPGKASSAVVPLQLHEALADFDAMHPVRPPWQRERDVLPRMTPQLGGIGVRDGDRIRAYLLSMPLISGISAMDCGSRAPTPDARTADAVALLLHQIRQQPDALVRAINIPPGDPLDAALAQLQCPIVATQREMLLTL
ncbi:MAG TPA: GNAT family N-acetyltransferase [Ktedonobacterales bacterium]